MEKGYHDGEMLKRIYLLAIFLGIASMCQARQRAWGFCERGGQKVTTAGILSTTNVQASYPQCNVTVYLTGTQTPATLFSDNSGTALGNPFTANTLGYWFFYADDGRYDIQISGGGLPAPFTFGDYNLSSGGGGGSGITQLSGDGSAGPGSGAQALTLASVNASIGTCGDATHVPQVTLNAKGLATLCTPVAISSTVVIEGAGTPNAGGTNPTTCPTQTGGVLTLYRDTSDPDLAIWRCKTAGTPGIWRLQLDSDGTGGTSIDFTEGTCVAGAAGHDVICADSAAHRFRMSNNSVAPNVIVGSNTQDILTSKTINTAGANHILLNGNEITDVSGTGGIVCLTVGSSCVGGGGLSVTTSGAGYLCIPACADSVTAANTWVSKVPRYYQFVLPYTLKVTNISLYLQVAPGAGCGGNCGITAAIYDKTCTKVAGSDITTLTGASAAATLLTLPAPVTLGPEVYFLGASTDSAVMVAYSAVDGTVFSALVNLTGNGGLRFFTGATSASGAGATLAMPASCGAKTVMTGPQEQWVLTP